MFIRELKRFSEPLSRFWRKNEVCVPATREIEKIGIVGERRLSHAHLKIAGPTPVQSDQHHHLSQASASTTAKVCS